MYCILITLENAWRFVGLAPTPRCKYNDFLHFDTKISSVIGIYTNNISKCELKMAQKRQKYCFERAGGGHGWPSASTWMYDPRVEKQYFCL
jgi:hypothetical protein